MKSDYNTKQKNIILSYLINEDNHITANELAEKMRAGGEKIGLATIYRQLDRLIASGTVRKYITDSGACYQYADEHCKNHFHLKCTKCGTLFHIDCSYLEALAPHILSHHDFTVDNLRTVMYGTCRECKEKAKTEDE